jgi:HEAT repeat protein
MWLFGLVCFVCLLFAPILASYFFSSLLLGSAVWAGRTLLLSRSSKRLLRDSRAQLLPATTSAVSLLDGGFVRKSVWTSDWQAHVDGLPILVRTEPRTVDETGAAIGFPWSRQDRKATHQVVAASIMIDLRDRIPPALCVHASFTHAETTSLGPEALIAGLFDGPVLDAARPGDQISLGDGLLSWDSPFALSAGLFDPVLSAMLHMAHRLAAVAKPGGVGAGELLLENLARDRREDVRARSVDALARDLPDRKEEALAIALTDPSALVRFAAARHVSDPTSSFAIVWRILEERQTDDGLAERALRHLLRRFPTDMALPVLYEVLEKKGLQLRRIVIRHLGEIRHARSVPWLVKLARNRPHPELAVNVAQALGAIGAPDGEPTLIELVHHDRHEVATAAIEALGHIGSRHAVSALRSASKRSKKLYATAETSLQMIEARIGPVTTGNLSLIDPDGGQLSLDSSETGAVSPIE